MLSTVMTIMTGSAILSAMSERRVSAAQSMLVTHAKHKLSHHVFSKQRGWVRQGAKTKPMLLVQARVDHSAYDILHLEAPKTVTRVSEGYHLADTGASICLGGKQFMRSLGMSEMDLTTCDMSVCGADNANINVLGAVLVEFAAKNTPLRSKQIVYICDGVAGALLSLEACVDLGLVNENFPQPTAQADCSAAQADCSAAQAGKKENCDCKCQVRSTAPDVPATIPFEPNAANVPKLEALIR